MEESGSNVPTFLLKLVSMLDDQANHEYVDWSPAESSFIVKDQAQFSKVVLPKYFKHNKFPSFVRQLNMYGFRKITSLTQSGLNSEKEEVEFYHYLFIRGEEQLLDKIKRKVNKPENAGRTSEDVTKVLVDVNKMKLHQESIDSRLTELKHENVELWREVVNLRQKHAHQQKVVNKLIQFLVNLVQQTGMGMKRKLPLMIEDGSSESVEPKYPKRAYIESETPLALEQPSKPTVSFPTSGTTAVGQEQSSKPSVSFPTSVAENELQNNPAVGSGPYITEVSSSIQPIEISEVNPEHDGLAYDQTVSNIGQQWHEAPSGSVNFPDEDFDGLIQNQSYQNPNRQRQASVPRQQSAMTAPALPQMSVVPTSANARISQAVSPRPVPSPKISPAYLNCHVDAMQNNIENIQDMLFNNDQVDLDYGLIQELFSTSPDIMPSALIPPESQNTGNVAGNEVVLHSRSNPGNSKKIVERDLSDLANML